MNMRHGSFYSGCRTETIASTSKSQYRYGIFILEVDVGNSFRAHERQPVFNQSQLESVVSAPYDVDLLPVLRQLTGSLMASTVTFVKLNFREERLTVIHSGPYANDLDMGLGCFESSNLRSMIADSAQLQECCVFDYNLAHSSRWREFSGENRSDDAIQDWCRWRMAELANFCLSLEIAIPVGLVEPRNYSAWSQLRNNFEIERLQRSSEARADVLLRFSEYLSVTFGNSCLDDLVDKLESEFKSMPAFGIEPSASSYWSELGAVLGSDHLLQSVATAEIRKEIERSLSEVPADIILAMYLNVNGHEDLIELIMCLGDFPSYSDLHRLDCSLLIDEVTKRLVGRAIKDYGECDI